MRLDYMSIPAYLLRLQPHPPQAQIQPLAHTGAGLAVDEADIGARQIFETLDPQRVPRPQDQAFLPPVDLHQRPRLAREQMADKWAVVFLGLRVDEMAGTHLAQTLP
jgi:hypothetical protein